jgi:hypothetical protein
LRPSTAFQQVGPISPCCGSECCVLTIIGINVHACAYAAQQVGQEASALASLLLAAPLLLLTLSLRTG